MSKPLVARIEVWNRLSCQAGAVALGALDWERATAIEEIQGVTVLERLSLRVTRASYALGQLAVQRVIRVQYIDATYDEYRIAKLDESAFGDGLVAVECNGILTDLARGDLLLRKLLPEGTVTFSVAAAADTPSDLLTDHVLANAQDYWTIGTVTPTAVVDPGALSGTPLQAAITIAEAVNFRTGATYELAARRNGTTDYRLDFVSAGATAATAYLRGGVHLQALQRVQDVVEQTTRVVPKDPTGRGIDDAWWQVTAVSTDAYIEIADPSGSAINPIRADDQFNTSFEWEHEDGSIHTITDTDRANQRLSMASTTGIAVGEWGRIRHLDNTPLVYVDDPTAQASYGIVVGEISRPVPAVTNWLKNGNMVAWSGALPDEWSGTATISKETGDGTWSLGGAAARPTTTGTLINTRSIYVPANAALVYTVWLRIDVNSTSGSSYISLYDGTGAQQFYLLNGTETDLNAQKPVGYQFTRTFQRGGSGGVQTVGVLMNFAATIPTVYIDAVMLEIRLKPSQVAGLSEAAAEEYVHHSGAAALWLAGCQHLDRNAMPVTTYQVTPLDLTRADRAAYPNADLVLGGQVQIDEPDELGLSTSQRLVRVETDHANPIGTRVTVATRPPDLTALLARVRGE